MFHAMEGLLELKKRLEDLASLSGQGSVQYQKQ